VRAECGLNGKVFHIIVATFKTQTLRSVNTNETLKASLTQ